MKYIFEPQDVIGGRVFMQGHANCHMVIEDASGTSASYALAQFYSGKLLTKWMNRPVMADYLTGNLYTPVDRSNIHPSR